MGGDCGTILAKTTSYNEKGKKTSFGKRKAEINFLGRKEKVLKSKTF